MSSDRKLLETIQRAEISNARRWEQVVASAQSNPEHYNDRLARKQATEQIERQRELDAQNFLAQARNANLSEAVRLASKLSDTGTMPEAYVSHKAAVQLRRKPIQYEQVPIWFVGQHCLMANEEFTVTTLRPDGEGPLAKWIPIPPIYGVVVQTDIMDSQGLRSTLWADRTTTPVDIDMDFGLWCNASAVSSQMREAQPVTPLNDGPVEQQLTEHEQQIPLRLLLETEINRRQSLAELALRYGL